MIIDGPSDEATMIATFLRAEIASPRFAPTLLALLARDGIPRALLDAPDLADRVANARRRALLGEYRGYGQDRELFAGFPAAVAWHRATLGRDDLAAARYIDYSYWAALSGGTRLAPDAARRIRAGETIYGVPNDGFWAIARAWERGEALPAPILVATAPGAPLVILEGHARLTAYFLVEGPVADPLAALIGFSPDLPGWSLY